MTQGLSKYLWEVLKKKIFKKHPPINSVCLKVLSNLITSIRNFENFKSLCIKVYSKCQNVIFLVIFLHHFPSKNPTVGYKVGYKAYLPLHMHLCVTSKMSQLGYISVSCPGIFSIKLILMNSCAWVKV